MQARCMRLVARHSTSSAFEVRNVEREGREFAERVAERLASNQEACTSIAGQLDQNTRRSLLQALAAAEGDHGEQISKTYLDNLFKEHDTVKPFGQLDRYCIHSFQSSSQAQALTNKQTRSKNLLNVACLQVRVQSCNQCRPCNHSRPLRRDLGQTTGL